MKALDIRLVAPTAKFSAAFVRVGLSMGELGTSYSLTRLVGPGRAAEIGYTGRVVGAEEAVRIGLANRVVPAERLLDGALAMAAVIAANSPPAYGCPSGPSSATRRSPPTRRPWSWRTGARPCSPGPKTCPRPWPPARANANPGSRADDTGRSRVPDSRRPGRAGQVPA